MTAVEVKTYDFDPTVVTDAQIKAGLGVTSTVFAVGICNISNTKMRIIMIYN